MYLPEHSSHNIIMKSIIDDIFRKTGRCRNYSCKFTALWRGFKSASVGPTGIHYVTCTMFSIC